MILGLQVTSPVECALLLLGQFIRWSVTVQGNLGWLPDGRGQAAAQRVNRLLRAGGKERQPRELRQERPVLSVLCGECCVSMAFSVAHGSFA